MRKMKTFIASEAPAHYKFVDPDTGYTYHAHSKQALISRIIAYREQNTLPLITELSLVIDNYLCSLPENSGKCQQVELNRSWLSFFKGGVSLLVNVFYKEQVTDEVAEERASQCVSCPFNVFPDKNAFVSWSDDMAERTTGGKKTSKHNELGNCSVCTCPLRCKVFFGGEIEIEPEWRDQMESVNCWQLEANKK